VGLTITQNGNQEDAAVFDPSNSRQAQTAIKAIQAKKLRKLSAVRRAKLAEVGQVTRLKPGRQAQNAL
jgi:hypothetical protein